MRIRSEQQALKTVVARNLSRLRAERDLSLSQLARRSGIAKGTLSKLEAASGNPTLETLWSIADALGVPLGAVLDKDDESVRVVRAAGSSWVGGAVLDCRLLDQLVGAGAVDVYEILIRPDAPHERSGKAPGSVDYVFVTAGRMLAGPADAPVELEAGDFIRYASDQPYVLGALGGAPTRGIQLISYQATARDPEAVREADGSATTRRERA